MKLFRNGDCWLTGLQGRELGTASPGSCSNAIAASASHLPPAAAPAPPGPLPGLPLGALLPLHHGVCVPLQCTRTLVQGHTCPRRCGACHLCARSHIPVSALAMLTLPRCTGRASPCVLHHGQLSACTCHCVLGRRGHFAVPS